MTKKIGLGILLAMMATAASAASSKSCQQPTNFLHYVLSLISGRGGCSGSGGGGTTHVNAPEIDPASAMAGLTLMVSGLAVMRGRRKSK